MSFSKKDLAVGIVLGLIAGLISRYTIRTREINILHACRQEHWVAWVPHDSIPSKMDLTGRAVKIQITVRVISPSKYKVTQK